jgi:hypothetical protein
MSQNGVTLGIEVPLKAPPIAGELEFDRAVG